MRLEPTTSNLGKSQGPTSKRSGNPVLFNNLAIEMTFRKASHSSAFFRVISGYSDAHGGREGTNEQRRSCWTGRRPFAASPTG